MSDGPAPSETGIMSHLQGLLFEINRYSAEAEPFLALAAEVADLPPDLLERALVVAVSLPKSTHGAKPAALKKAQAPFLQALTKRCPGLEALLKDLNLMKVFADPPMEGPWKSYEKALKIVDAVDFIDAERFSMAAMELWFSGGAATALLTGALARSSSSSSVFAAYRACFERAELTLHVELELDGEMVAGVGALQGVQWMTLRGRHTGTAHLDELATFAPFGLHYMVRSPDLENLLPLRNQIASLTVKRCADFKPALQFERLERIVVASEDLARAFAVLGGRAGLMIADPVTASDPEGAARQRATFLGEA
ncbi:MAG: hypothetical protein IPO88_21145 [Nannocystis sp.]|uniref:hypothetical protein n=1 Tax=Nannocystis sp. TaxID=1962667 RepID=UPI0024264CBB|nr:hypothetical protein [Nannocystis sp.]MBK9755959.1 hypothetical protein [Nannocystis sp.]